MKSTSNIIDHRLYEAVVSDILMIHEIPHTDPERLAIIRELIFNVISIYLEKQIAGETPEEIQ